MNWLRNISILLIAVAAYPCYAQKTAMFKGKKYLVYPYRMQLTTPFNHDPELGLYRTTERSIPPFPGQLSNGDYIIFYNATPTDSVNHISAVCAATCTFRDNMLNGKATFYDYRRDHPGNKSRVISDGRYLNNAKQGEWRSEEFSDYGLPLQREICNYKNDLLHGAYEQHDERGNYYYGTFENAKKQGLWRSHNQVYHFDQGLKHGEQIDTLILIIQRSVYTAGKLTGFSLYNIATGNVEYIVSNVVESEVWHEEASMVHHDLLFSTALAQIPVNFKYYDLQIFNNGVAAYAFTIEKPADFLKANYKKLIQFKDKNGLLQSFEEVLESIPFEEWRSAHPLFIFRNSVNGKLLKEKVYAVSMGFPEIWYRDRPAIREAETAEFIQAYASEFRSDPVVSDEQFTKGITEHFYFSSKYYEFILGYLPAVVLKDSILFGATDSIACFKTSYYLLENKVGAINEVRLKGASEFRPLNAYISRRDGQIVEVELTLRKMILKGQTFEFRQKFGPPKIIRPGERNYYFTATPSVGEFYNTSQLAQFRASHFEDNAFFDHWDSRSSEQLFYLNNKAFDGKLILQDTVLAETAGTTTRARLISASENEVYVQVNAHWYAYLPTHSKIEGRVPYTEYFPTVIAPQRYYHLQSIHQYNYSAGALNGPSREVKLDKDGNIYLYSVLNYSQNKLHGPATRIIGAGNEFDLTIYKGNYEMGKAEGLQIYGKPKPPVYNFLYPLDSLYRAKRSWSNMIGDMEFPVIKDTTLYVNLSKGVPRGRFLVVGPEHKMSSDVNANWLADSILVTDQYDNPVTKIVIDKNGNGSITQYYPKLTEDPLAIESLYLIRDSTMVSPFRKYYRNGQVAMVQQIDSSSGSMRMIKAMLGNSYRLLTESGDFSFSILFNFEDLNNFDISVENIDQNGSQKFEGQVTFYYPTGAIAASGAIGRFGKTGIWKYFYENGMRYLDIDLTGIEFVKHPRMGYTQYDRKGKVDFMGIATGLHVDVDCESMEPVPCVVPEEILSMPKDSALQVLPDGKKCTWITVYRYNWNKYAEGYYCAASKSKEGVWKMYKKNGMLTAIGNYKDNQKDGRWISGDLDGVNYMENTCFDPKDSVSIREYMKNIQFSQSIWDMGKELRSSIVYVNTTGEEGNSNSWSGLLLHRYFYPAPKPVPAYSIKDYLFFRNNGAMEYLEGGGK